jgi:hypothetical protein
MKREPSETVTAVTKVSPCMSACIWREPIVAGRSIPLFVSDTFFAHNIFTQSSKVPKKSSSRDKELSGEIYNHTPQDNQK